MEQDKFEQQCKAKVLCFFRKYKTATRRFSEEDRDRVREANNWNDLENFIVQETKKGESVKVFVR